MHWPGNLLHPLRPAYKRPTPTRLIAISASRSPRSPRPPTARAYKMKVKAIIADPVMRTVDFVDVDVDDVDRGSDDFAKDILGCEYFKSDTWCCGRWIDAPYWTFNNEFKAICCQMPGLDETPDDEDLGEYHCVEWVHNAIDVEATRYIMPGEAPAFRHTKMPGKVLYVKSVHAVPYVNSFMFAVTNMTVADMAVIQACVQFVDPVT
jgi:hypothetical protein